MAASRGLGYASALALSREGCDLVICSRDEARIRAAAETHSRRKPAAACHAVAADVSGEREAAQLVETRGRLGYGGLDIVVHNAGGPPAGEFVVDDRGTVAEGLRAEPAQPGAYRAGGAPAYEARAAVAGF